MTPKKTDTPKADAPAPLWRLAEIFQMRRMYHNSRDGQYSYYECQLCGGKSLLATKEIQHAADCPVERMRLGK
jgi:hypothetical protein